MCGVDIGAPKSVVSGDAILAPRSSSAAGLEVCGLLLPGSPGFLPSPIDWRQVEDNAAFACSWVTDAKRLLHETFALIAWDILRLIRVSLKKERKVFLYASGFL
jgi:hypothetical protein